MLKLKYEIFHKLYSTFALMNQLNEIFILAVTSQCHFIKLILPQKNSDFRLNTMNKNYFTSYFSLHLNSCIGFLIVIISEKKHNQKVSLKIIRKKFVNVYLFLKRFYLSEFLAVYSIMNQILF